MKALPEDLAERLYAHDPSPALVSDTEVNGNRFCVIHKGMRRDVDSNAIAVENDCESVTAAFEVLKKS